MEYKYNIIMDVLTLWLATIWLLRYASCATQSEVLLIIVKENWIELQQRYRIDEPFDQQVPISEQSS